VGRGGLLAALIGALLLGCGDAVPLEPPPPAPIEKAPTAAPAPAVVLPGGAYRAESLKVLSDVIDREAGKPANAWALAHGVLAKGPEFGATDGRRAIDVLVKDFLKADKISSFKGLQPYFPKSTDDGIPVEPHTDLVLKTLVDVGLGLEDPLTSKEGAPTLERLLRGSRLRHDPDVAAKGSTAFPKPDDVAWSIQAWCQATGAGAPVSWTTATGEQEHVDTVSLQQLEMLEAETWFMRQAMVEGGTVQKRRQGIFSFTCGGAHLFQSVAACAAVGHPANENVQKRVAAQLDIYIWRVALETGLIEEAMRQAPKLAPVLYNQDVKFLGHFLESVGKAERDGLFVPSAEQRNLIDDAETRLLAHVLQMSRLGVYSADKLAMWWGKEATRQFYLDVVGDACHAWSGLQLQRELREKASTE
jgi:hypothetical protein